VVFNQSTSNTSVRPHVEDTDLRSYLLQTQYSSFLFHNANSVARARLVDCKWGKLAAKDNLDVLTWPVCAKSGLAGTSPTDIQGRNRDLAVHLTRWLGTEVLEDPSALGTPNPGCESCPFMEQNGELVSALEPSYELAVSRAYCIMLLPLVKRASKK
jgi:hypothetical protein